MPVLDMPMDELKVYRGSTPCPGDFDAFWQRGIDEINKVDPAVEVVKADFETEFAECFHLYFTGTRNARVYAKYVKPKIITQPGPALFMFHGYSCDAGDWVDKLTYAAAGFSVFAMDCRGQGGLSEDPGGVKGNTLNGHIIRGLGDSPDNLYYRQVFLDTVQLTTIVSTMEHIDENRIACLGGSQGGGLSIACAGLNPQISRCVTMYPFLSDYKRVWDMDLAENAYLEVKDYFRRFDPRHEREDEVFRTLGYVDVQNLAPRIKGKVLMATGLLDDICPPSTQFAAYNKMTCEKKVVIYPDYKHEWIPGFGDMTFQFLCGM
jgi:cephalosporin-C deacetylase